MVDNVPLPILEQPWLFMFHFTPVLTLAEGHEEAISDVTSRLQSNDLRVVRSFDLQSACAYSGESTNPFCPHHPDQPCDCQLVVLLVYSDDGAPVSLIAHSNDGMTQIGLSTFPNEMPNPALESRITAVLIGAPTEKASPGQAALRRRGIRIRSLHAKQ